MAEKVFTLNAKTRVDGKVIDVEFEGEKVVVMELTIRESSMDKTLNPALKAANIKKLSDAEATHVSKLGKEQAFYSLVAWKERNQHGELLDFPGKEWMIRFKEGSNITMPDGTNYHVHPGSIVRFINKKAEELAQDESALFEDDLGNS